MTENNTEKVYLEKKLRLIIEQRIGISKILDTLKEKYEIKVLNDDNEMIILIEPKE